MPASWPRARSGSHFCLPQDFHRFCTALSSRCERVEFQFFKIFSRPSGGKNGLEVCQPGMCRPRQQEPRQRRPGRQKTCPSSGILLALQRLRRGNDARVQEGGWSHYKIVSSRTTRGLVACIFRLGKGTARLGKGAAWEGDGFSRATQVASKTGL